MSTIRKAARADLDAVCRIYDQIHTAEERGEAAIGWHINFLIRITDILLIIFKIIFKF